MEQKTKNVATPIGDKLFKALFNLLSPYDRMGDKFGQEHAPEAETLEQQVEEIMKDDEDVMVNYRVTRLEWLIRGESSVELITYNEQWDEPTQATLTLKKGNKVLLQKELSY
ncbi:MAG: hypothetical protein QM737_02860 [Ferruginibacter sp.]